MKLSDLDLLFINRQRIAVETKRQLMQLFLQSSQAPCPLELSVLVFSTFTRSGILFRLICTTVSTGGNRPKRTLSRCLAALE